jgi:tetratricopeptide (TPR) repeat protein
MRSAAIALLALLSLAAPSHAQLLGGRTEATNCASAIGGNVTASHISVVCGIPPEVLDALIKGRTQPLEKLVAAHEKAIALLEQNLDLNRGQIRAALNVLGEANVAPEQIATKLIEFAERYKSLRTATVPQPDDTAKVVALKSDAKNAIERGDLPQADQLLATIEQLQDEEIGRLALSRAETSAQRGEIALTRLRYGEAATHFAAAAARIPAGHDDLRLGYLASEADSLYRQGNEFGDNPAAALAITRFREMLALQPRERAPLNWAAAQNNLGLALRALGERESGTARLDAAVEAFREALKERTRQRVPLDWAMTQNNLGIALQILGERERGTARLDAAVEAFGEALKEWTRERAPLDWAATQNNLGATLKIVGERESGTAQLDAAVEAFREALKEWTHERAPLDWAATQNNLGTALGVLGSRESGTARLDAAVDAFREALKVWTRERVPLRWAATQHNLGAVLRTLGTREGGTARLDAAVDAYREALKEWTRERVPLDWAMSHGNQGIALMWLAERRADARVASQAVEQIEAARSTMKEGGHEQHAAYYEDQLPTARALLDRLNHEARR